MQSFDTRTLVERIADELRSQVIDGRLEPGRRVRQEDIAGRLGVSRTPLREAFRQLESEGWFTSHPRQGVLVSAMSYEEVCEIATARMVLEPAAARVAAVVHDDAAAARLRELVGTTSATPEVHDFDGLNRAFHLEVYGATDHTPPTELSRSTRHYWERFTRYRRYYWRAEEHISLSAEHHVHIADLWCARDGAATEAAVARHIISAISDQIRVLHPGSTPDPALAAVCRRYDIELRP